MRSLMFVFSIILLGILSCTNSGGNLDVEDGVFQNQMQIAVKYIDDGKYEKSIEVLDALLGMDTTNAEVYYYLGYCYQCLGEDFLPINFYIKSIENNYPRKEKVYYNMSILSYNTGGFDDAIYLLNDAILQDSLNPKFYKFRGDNYLILKDTLCACSDFYRALELGDTLVKYELDTVSANIDTFLIHIPCNRSIVKDYRW